MPELHDDELHPSYIGMPVSHDLAPPCYQG